MYTIQKIIRLYKIRTHIFIQILWFNLEFLNIKSMGKYLVCVNKYITHINYEHIYLYKHVILI